ncbi:hypothetical protein NQZ68_008347, partial [Dissostichus eleginoides]
MHLCSVLRRQSVPKQDKNFSDGGCSTYVRPPPPSAEITVRELPPPTSSSRTQSGGSAEMSSPLEGRTHVELP